MGYNVSCAVSLPAVWATSYNITLRLAICVHIFIDNHRFKMATTTTTTATATTTAATGSTILATNGDSKGKPLEIHKDNLTADALNLKDSHGMR